jgi:DUF971 family protein
MEPKGLTVSERDGKITILWSDGHSAIYDPFNLRRACPCAVCKGEPGVFGKYYNVPRMEVDPNVQPQAIEAVGRYGFKIAWTDHHDVGIYTFEYLRKLCECEECKRNRGGTTSQRPDLCDD